MSLRKTGFHWETQAMVWLEQQGLSLCQRNFHCRQGEIDLIMHDQDTLVFVEVKYRSRTDFGSAAELITWHKQQRLIRAAGFFLVKNPKYSQLPCRFDVIGIEASAGTDGEEKFIWLKNAFDLS